MSGLCTMSGARAAADGISTRGAPSHARDRRSPPGGRLEWCIRSGTSEAGAARFIAKDDLADTLLDAVLDTLLPGDADWPSAGTLALASTVESDLDPAALNAVLDRLPPDFAAGDADRREAILRAIETAEPGAFARLVDAGRIVTAGGISAGMELGFHLLRRAGYDESFVADVARVMEYHAAYELYRSDRMIAAVPAAL